MLIECPNCGRKISDQAERCPHCGFDPTAAQQSPQVCRECGQLLHEGDEVCPNCGAPTNADRGAKASEQVKSKRSYTWLLTLLAATAAFVACLLFLTKNETGSQSPGSTDLSRAPAVASGVQSPSSLLEARTPAPTVVTADPQQASIPASPLNAQIISQYVADWNTEIQNASSPPFQPCSIDVASAETTVLNAGFPDGTEAVEFALKISDTCHLSISAYQGTVLEVTVSAGSANGLVSTDNWRAMCSMVMALSGVQSVQTRMEIYSTVEQGQQYNGVGWNYEMDDLWPILNIFTARAADYPL